MTLRVKRLGPRVEVFLGLALRGSGLGLRVKSSGYLTAFFGVFSDIT